MKVFNPPVFTINVVSKPKVKSKTKSNNISRKCFAVVKEIDGEFKAVVNISKNYICIKEGDKLSNEQLILPFTKNSLELKDKSYVFLKNKDEYNHYVCIIRDIKEANLYPGTKDQYDVVKNNILIAGYIVNKNNKMYFEYEDLVSFHYLAEFHISDIKIDDTKPLFTK